MKFYGGKGGVFYNSYNDFIFILTPSFTSMGDSVYEVRVHNEVTEGFFKIKKSTLKKCIRLGDL